MTRWLLAVTLGCTLGACATPRAPVTTAMDQCRAYLSKGQYEEANRLCGADFAVIEQSAGLQKQNARQLTALASSAIRFGDYRLAERAAGLAVAYDEDARAVMALAAYKLGNYEAAIARGSEYLERQGPRAPMAFDALQAVASALATLERFDEARQVVATANQAAAAMGGSFAAVSANTLESSVLWLAGEKKASGELAARTLTLAIQSGFDTSTLLGNIARLRFEEGKYEEARALLEKSLAVSQIRIWPAHPEYARTMNDLGLIDYKTGRSDDAETRFLKALQVLKQRVGPAHISVAQASNNLGALYHRLGDLDQAAALYERALDIDWAALGAGNQRSQRVFTNLEILAKDRRGRTVPRREPMLDGP